MSQPIMKRKGENFMTNLTIPLSPIFPQGLETVPMEMFADPARIADLHVNAAAMATTLEEAGVATAGLNLGQAGVALQKHTVRFAEIRAAMVQAKSVLGKKGDLIAGVQLEALIKANHAKIIARMLSFPRGDCRVGHFDGKILIEWETAKIPGFKISEIVTNREYRAWLDSLSERRYFLIQVNSWEGPDQVIAVGTAKAIFELVQRQFRDRYFIVKGYGPGSMVVLDAEYYPHSPAFDAPDQPAEVSRVSAYLYALLHGTRLPTKLEMAMFESEGGKKGIERNFYHGLKNWLMDYSPQHFEDRGKSFLYHHGEDGRDYGRGFRLAED